MNCNFPKHVSVSRRVTVAEEKIQLQYAIDFSGATEADLIELAVNQAVVDITNGLFRKLTPEQVKAYNGKTISFDAKAKTAGKMTSAQVYDQAIALGIPEATARKLANME